MGKEAAHFTKLANLPQLKIFHINVSYLRTSRRRNANAKPNKEYQDDESIKPYSQALGFDKLVQIRGLKRVTVVIPGYFDHSPESVAALKTFEALLNGILPFAKTYSWPSKCQFPTFNINERFSFPTRQLTKKQKKNTRYRVRKVKALVISQQAA